MTDSIKDLETTLVVVTAESEKIDTLHALAWELREDDPQRALWLGQAAHDLARRSNYLLGLTHSLKTLGYCNAFAGHYELALSQLLEAKALFETLGEQSGQSAVLYTLGTLQWQFGNNADALEYALQALQIAEEIGDRISQAEALNNIGLIYGDTGDHLQGLSFFRKALTLFEEVGDKRGQAAMLNNLAVDYYQLANYPEALTCGFAALELVQESGGKLLEVYIRSTIGETYLEMGEYQQALDACRESLELSKVLKSRHNEQFCLYYIGKIHYHRQEIEPALSSLKQALAIATEVEAKPMLYKCHQLLAEIYESQGEFEQALAHYKQFHQFYQAVFNEEGDKKLKNLEVRYRTVAAQKEAEIHRLRNVELERQIAERQRAEAQSQHRADELTALIEVGHEISATLNLSTVLERIAERAKDMLQAVDAAVYVLQPDGRTLQAVVAASKYADEIKVHPLELGVGIIGNIAQSGTAEIVNKPSQDSRLHHFAGSWDEEVGADDDLYPLIVAPIVVKETIIGVIAAWRYIETGLFSQTHLNFLDALSQQAAVAIQNAYLFEAEQRQRRLAEQRSQELEIANTSLRAMNAELDAFAHTVAHDLKNPLGVITSYGDFLTRDDRELDPDDIELIFKELQKSGRKALNIIEELLLLASVRKGSVRLKPLEMDQIVEEAQRRLQLMIKEYQAEISYPQSWPRALGYAPWIEEVWVNYLSNGMKYGGQPPRLELGTTPQADKMIRFWIRDNGPGLTPEAQAKLFAEFTRLDEVRAEGHGLGLSIVRRIIEKLGGEVGVESEGVPGRGSVFYFTLAAR